MILSLLTSHVSECEGIFKNGSSVQLAASKLFNLPPDGIALLYRGRKKADNEVLSLAGVKNGTFPALVVCMHSLINKLRGRNLLWTSLLSNELYSKELLCLVLRCGHQGHGDRSL